MARLGDIVTIQTSSKQLSGNRFWLLNLDMIEQQTGNIIDYNYVSADCLNGSIIQFDSDAVLYSKLRPNLNKVVLPQIDGYATSEMLPLKPDSGKITREYLAEFLRSDGFVTWAVSKTAGAKMPRLGTKELLNAEIPLPSLDEQGQIAQLFGQTSKLISLRKQQLTKLDELAKARFVEMFGDPVKNTMGWQSEPLNDVCDVIGDGLHGTPEYDDSGNYPFINGNNLIDGRIVITPATKMVSEETYKKHLIDISPNAILISINGTLGKLAFYNGEQVMLGKSACYCNLKPSVNKLFVYGVMKSDAFAEFLDSSSTKSTIKNVGLKAMREYKLILPPTELQEQYATFVEQVDKSKLTIQQSLDKLETLKKSLMQKYFG